jgi:hypothetical protein
MKHKVFEFVQLFISWKVVFYALVYRMLIEVLEVIWERFKAHSLLGIVGCLFAPFVAFPGKSNIFEECPT